MQFDLMTGARHGRRRPTWPVPSKGPGSRGCCSPSRHRPHGCPSPQPRRRAPSLEFMTGIAVAFPRSPMVAASLAWELAENTEGRFRLGLGSQVQGARRAAVQRRVRPAGPADARLRAGACRPASAPSAAKSRSPTTGRTTSCPCCRRHGRRAPRRTATSRSTSPRSVRGCAAWRARTPTASTSIRCTRCPISRTG